MATQATALAPASQSALTKALSMKGEIVAYHQAATRAAEEAMENLFQCGRLLESVRDILKAEKTTSFGKWVEQFCGFSERSAQGYCKLHNDLRDLTKAQRAALFNRHQSQRAVTLFLSESQKPEEKEPTMPTPKPAKVESTPQEPKPSCFVSTEDQYPNEPVDRVFDIPFTTEELATPQPEDQSDFWPPEPWTWHNGIILDGKGKVLETNTKVLERIVICVNAMAGIHDPKAFVARHEHNDHAQWLAQVEPCEPVE